MINVNADVRTVRLVKDLTESKDGNANNKMIMFRVASRNAQSTTDTNGNKTQKTDFLTLKAFGKTAEVLAKYATDTKENGELKSRHLLVSGYLESYDQSQGQTPIINGRIPMKQGNDTGFIDIEVPENEKVYVLHKQTTWSIVAYNVQFLDSNANSSSTSATGKNFGHLSMSSSFITNGNGEIKGKTTITTGGNVQDAPENEEPAGFIYPGAATNTAKEEVPFPDAEPEVPVVPEGTDFDNAPYM